jgi:hypothetical protein
VLDLHKLQAKFTAQQLNIETSFLGKVNIEMPLILARARQAALLNN